MAITNGIKSYNIYNESGCDIEDTSAGRAEKIAEWINSTFPEEMEAKVSQKYTTSSLEYYHVQIYYKNSALGVYISSFDDKSSPGGNIVSVGMCRDSQDLTISNGEQYNISKKNLYLFTFRNGNLFGFFPYTSLGEKNFATAGYADGKYNIAVIVATDKKGIYVCSDKNLIQTDNYMNARAAIDQKVLLPPLFPNQSCLCENLYISDGITVDNHTVYEMNGRYFMDLIRDNNYQCLTIELKEATE